MHSTCTRCNGRGTLDLCQLSDYFDCPDCNGTGVIQPWRIRWPTINWVRPVWSWTKSFIAVLVFVAVVAAITLGSSIERQRRVAYCNAAGGHYVAQPFSTDECWSSDGHRIFPEGF